MWQNSDERFPNINSFAYGLLREIEVSQVSSSYIQEDESSSDDTSVSPDARLWTQGGALTSDKGAGRFM